MRMKKREKENKGTKEKKNWKSDKEITKEGCEGISIKSALLY